MKLIKNNIVLLLSASLAACGGSGGDSKSIEQPAPEIPDTLTISLGQESVTLLEGEGATFTLNADYSGSAPLSYDITVSGDAVEASAEGNELVVNTLNTEELGVVATVTVTATDGKISDSAEINVSVENTSFWEKHDALTVKAAALSDFAESEYTAHNLITFGLDVDYRTGLITETDFQERLPELLAPLDDALTSIANSSSDVAAEIAAITPESDATESDLDAYEEQLSQLGADYSQSVSSAIASTRSFDGVVLPEMAMDALHFYANGYSLFYGNPDLGLEEQGEWRFYKEFQFLSALVDASVCVTL